MKFFNKNIMSAIILQSALIAGLLVLFIPGIVYADQPPLQPGCYARDGDEFVKANCKTENQARSIVAPYNKCFAASISPSQGLGPFSEIDCRSGTLAAADTGDESNSPGEVEPHFVRNDCRPPAGEALSKENCGIVKYIIMFIDLLSALAGVVIVGSMVAGGIQYSSAGSDPQKVSAAKNRIRNAIIALILFLFGYALLNYLVPGGVL